MQQSYRRLLPERKFRPLPLVVITLLTVVFFKISPLHGQSNFDLITICRQRKLL